MIPYGRQNINQDDIDAVVSVLSSDFLTQGPLVADFENAISKYCGADYAVAVNSATSALHIACLALGVGPSDIVWTSPITFVASANCVLYCGATIDFVDIDKNDYTISIPKLEEKLQKAKLNGTLPKVLIPVHLAGQSCKMREIHQLSIAYGFTIIEDASHAIGAKYENLPIGSCKYSHITIFSFHPVKIITTGEGGMALTNDRKIANRMVLLRSHGITRDPDEMTCTPDGPWYYQQIDLGFNYRMTDFQAALGLSQMRRIDEFVGERQKIANIYRSLLAEENLKLPEVNPDCFSSFHLYVVRLDPKFFNHRMAFERCRSRGIAVNLHYIPVYRQPYFSKFNFNSGDFPESEAYYKEAISLPIFPGITIDEIKYVVESLTTPLGYQTLF